MKKYEVKNYGFVVDPESLADEHVHYKFGSSPLPLTILRADGQWDEYLPTYEAQADRFETWGCTVWGTQNAIETQLKLLVGKEFNFSERYNYILGKVRAPGASPHDIAEIIRKKGLVNQESLPMTDTYDEFLKPDPMTAELLTEGQKWLVQYDFGHEWVFTPTNLFSLQTKQQALMEALKYGTVCVSVHAWKKREKYFFKAPTDPDTHWCQLYGFVEGQYWKVFDSYNNSIKLLEWGYDFWFAKRYNITIKSVEEVPEGELEVKIPWWKKLWDWIIGLFKQQNYGWRCA